MSPSATAFDNNQSMNIRGWRGGRGEGAEAPVCSREGSSQRNKGVSFEHSADETLTRRRTMKRVERGWEGNWKKKRMTRRQTNEQTVKCNTENI